MNKEQLVSATARKMKASKGEENRYAKWEIAVMLQYILDTISEIIANGEEVQLQGFGRFSIKTVKAHNGINPRTKERIWVPEKKGRLSFDSTLQIQRNGDNRRSYRHPAGEGIGVYFSPPNI